MDYSRKFLEAASRYHELSWVAEIDEEERQHMLQVLPLPFINIQILITPQLSGSNMRRPRPGGPEPVSSPRLPMQRRTDGRPTLLQYPTKNVPRSYPPLR